MKLATYNVENMFDRAKALNTAAWSVGRPALEAHRELNSLFNKDVYTADDKTRMLKLLKDQGLLKKDDGGKFLILRMLRGKLLNRPRSGPVTVAANGRADWIGWVELLTEPVSEVATENTARVIHEVDADVLGIVEVEDRTTLCRFNDDVLPAAEASPYAHAMLVDGNDERGIDVGILCKTGYDIRSMRSHVDDADESGQIFSRDCAEYQVHTPSGKDVWVLVNHFKSKGYGKQSDNDAKRKRQAERVRAIVDEHLQKGETLVAVMGDFNDGPARDPLSPLLAKDSPLKDVSEHAAFDNGGRPGTHGNCTASEKLDYILLSSDLFAAVQYAGVDRHGMWGGKNGALWPHYPQVTSADDVASDHAALWVELTV